MGIFGDNWHTFLWGGVPFLSPNQECQSTKGNSKVLTPNQWPVFIFSSSIVRFLREGALLPLYWLFDTTLPDEVVMWNVVVKT